MIIRKYTDAELLQRWSRLLESGPRIKDNNTKVVLAKLFENTYKDMRKNGVRLIKEAGPAVAGLDAERVAPGPRNAVLGDPGADRNGRNIGGFMRGKDSAAPRDVYTAQGSNQEYYMPNVVMPMLRRIFPDLIANELVGVQAMQGPVGLAMALRFTYHNGKRNAGILGDGTLSSDREIGFDSPDTRYTGISGSISGDLSGKTSSGDGLSGVNISSYTGVGNDRDEAWGGIGADVNEASEFASFRDGTYPTAQLGLIRSTVTAKTRKLGGQWSPELAEDMDAVHGINVENEIVNLITYEVGAEIDRQIVTEMVKAAFTGESVSAWNPAEADGLDQMGRLATLLTQITVQANYIALKTRRGSGNFVIASPKVTALLEQLSMNKYVSFASAKQVPSVPYSGVGALQKQGLINDGNQLLIRDAFAGGDYVLIGYKGQHPGDAGIIYCPYIPLMVQRALNPDTMNPVVGCRTRYGIMNTPWDASKYYHFMSINGLDSVTYRWGDGRRFLAPVNAEGLPR